MFGQEVRLDQTYSNPALFGQNGDAYRHGTVPEVEKGTTRCKIQGGKVAWNILYADGHVTPVIDRTEGYQ